MNDNSGILYICGHPGQGKTAVVNQVLDDHFGQGHDENEPSDYKNLIVFKYNAMSFNNLAKFLDNFIKDVEMEGDERIPNKKRKNYIG